MTTTRALALWTAAVAVAVLALPLRAQLTSAASIYRLGTGSAFQTGCFPPCLCPVTPPTSFPKGTFRLVFTGQDPQFRNYAVQDVNWFVDVAGQMTRITGSGTYKVTIGPIPLAHRLELDLAVGANAVQHFDSGVVPVSGAGPPAMQIKISINGGQCQDTIISLAAAPVPASQMIPYALTNTTTYASGCFPPCCVAPPPAQPISGTFTLIPLPTYSTNLAGANRAGQDFAVINAQWAVQGPVIAPGQSFTGYGIYRRRFANAVTPLAGVGQRLVLDLGPRTSAAPVEFDSGWKPFAPSPAAAALPWIDLPISANDFGCQDSRFDVHARPTP